MKFIERGGTHRDFMVVFIEAFDGEHASFIVGGSEGL